MSDDGSTRIIGSAPPAASSGRGELPDWLVATPVWSDELVARAGFPIVDVPIVSVGGGLGSFALIDTLRIAGVGARHLAVLGNGTVPTRTYRYLASASQIPDHERLRSDSGSTMDNIWGFPSYAFREAASAPTLRGRLAPLWSVVSEPFGADYYTPTAGAVYESVDREAARIGWESMVRPGVVRMIRRREGGGYFSVLTGLGEGDHPTRTVYRSRHVHVAVGYPGVKFLPDLQAYRERHRDFSRVVNAYEPHDHLYAETRHRPTTVLVRGSGIVASRILQRLLDDREAGLANTTVYHLFRTYVSGPQGDRITFRRPGANGWAYQGFNYPKAAWGGQLKRRLEQLDGPKRVELIRAMGGTNTPPRASWRRQLDRGRAGGWYVAYTGQVERVDPGPDQTVVSGIVDDQGRRYSLGANFVIDATGLESDIGEHRLLADLLAHGGARRSELGRLAMLPTFEVEGTRSDPGRLYASGSATLGGYYAGVDSFLGLQYAALTIADDLASIGSAPRLGARRSTSQWWRWLRHLPPSEVTS